MLINNIFLKNIGPHSEINLDLNTDNLAICGSNGSGKSFLIESIPACFYGEWPSRGNLSNGIKKNQAHSILKVSFEKDGHSFIAERKISYEKTIKQDCYLFKDDEVIAGPKITDFEREIKNVVGPKEVFLSSSFSSQKQAYDLVDAKPQDRKKILATILEFGELEKKQAKFNSFLKQTNLDLQLEKNSQYHLKNLKTVQQKGVIVELNKQISCLEKEYLTQRKKLEESKTDFDKINKEYIENQTVHDANVNNKNRYNMLLDRKKALTKALKDQEHIDFNIAEHEKIQKERDKAFSLNKKAKSFNENLNKQKSIAKAQLEKNEQLILKRKEFETSLCNFEKVKNKKGCLHCNLYKEAQKSRNKLKKLESILTNDEVQELKNILNIPEKKISEIADDQILFLNKLKNDKLKMDLYEDELNALEAELKMLKPSLIDNENNDIYDELIKAQDNLHYLENSCDLLNSSLNKKKNALDIALNIKTTNDELDKKLKSSFKKETSLNLDHSTYKYLEKAFGKNGLQAFLIDSAIPDLQEIANELILKIEPGLFIELSTQKELKNGNLAESLEIFCSKNNETRSVQNFSGGEQQIIKICIRLAIAIFQKEKSKFHFETLVLDEIFDSLDQAHTGSLMGLLNSLNSQFNRILFVSHREDILSELPEKFFLEN